MKIVMVTIERTWIPQTDSAYAIDLDQFPDNPYKEAVLEALNSSDKSATFSPYDHTILNDALNLSLDYPFNGTVVGSVTLFID